MRWKWRRQATTCAQVDRIKTRRKWGDQGLRWLWAATKVEWNKRRNTRREQSEPTGAALKGRGAGCSWSMFAVPIDALSAPQQGQSLAQHNSWDLRALVEGAEHTDLLSWIYTFSFTEQSRFLLCWFQPFLTLMQSSAVKNLNSNKPQSNHKALSCLLTLLLSFSGYSTSVRSQCPYKIITKFSSSPRKLQLGQDKHWGQHPEHALSSPWSCLIADISLDECLKEFERSTCFKSK